MIGRTRLSQHQLGSRPSSVWVLSLVGLVVGSFLMYWLWGYPVEDASMLFAYSENIAAGHGVVYNPGGETVDGASDLLFAFILAGLKLLGLPVDVGAALVNAVGLGFMVFAVWASWKRAGLGSHRFGLGAVAVLLVPIPFLVYGATGFGTLFFASLVTLVVFLLLRMSSVPTTAQLVLVGGAIALAGMDRIEGFFLGGIIVLAHSVATRSWRTLLIPGATAMVIAVAWFSWRWSYFGYPLPNAYYKKGTLNQDLLRSSFAPIVRFGAPWLLVLAIGIFVRHVRRFALSYLFIVVAPWLLIWILVSNEMNLAGRFQVPVVPALAALSSRLAPVIGEVQTLWDRWRRETRHLAVLSAIGILCMAAVLGVWRIRTEAVQLSNLRNASFHEEIALAISRASGNSGNLVTAEAGMTAWKTDLFVTDLWGLNHKEIAHRGLLKPDEIAALSPEIVFAHPGDPKVFEKGVSGTSDESFDRLTVYLFCFVQANSFEPVAIWKGPNENHWWVVLSSSDSVLQTRLRQELSQVAINGEYPTVTPIDLPVVDDCESSVVS